MSSPTQKPDLEDSINVTEAHGRIVREAAACAREKRIAANGTEPISLGVLAACGLVAVIAGGILGGAGNWFSYATIFRDGYVRTPPPGAVDEGPKPKEALAAYMARGAKIYSVKCNGCHGSDAKGDGANFPSLVGSKWALGETDRFAMIILNGLQGPTSTGKTYGAGIMPSQGAGLSPEDLAGVMTYVRNNFGNTKGDVVTVDMAKAAMDISAKRAKAGQPSTGTELEAEHAKDLPGEPLDPKTLVDPITLAPATAAK
jgi:mono/diheme cytochrome c family protein